MPGRWIRFSCNYIFLLCTLFYATGAGAAEWYKEYEAGLDLIKKGRYAESIPRLQSAIAQKNQEGNNIKFYGMKFADYFPHYYLGRAYFYQKNYQAASNEFQISANQGEIQRNSSLFQNLSELKTLATAQLKLTDPTPPQIAEKKPEPVQPNPEPIAPKQEQAQPPEKKPDPVVAVREQPKKEEPTIAKTETPPPIEKPQPSPEELNLQRAKSIVRGGARKYFQGDFDGAIAAFSSALTLAPEDNSAQFLLGCSYAAKYLLSGSKDQASLQKATAAFQKTRKNHPLTKNPLISPAVKEIYEKAAGA
jgi:tetratricopeptide (TPR) repeat protein